MKKETQEALNECYVEGNIIKPPKKQLDAKTYADLKKEVLNIGGKWVGGKVFGFVFSKDPTELLQQIQSGESRNIKKETQAFYTPPELARKLVDMAGIRKHMMILEPSAGEGAIIDAILETNVYCDVYYCEKSKDSQKVLSEKYKYHDHVNDLAIEGDDFLNMDLPLHYDCVIANPPFTNNQDIDHVLKMWESIDYRGRIVTIMSTHWQLSSNKKEKEFREWLSLNKARITELPAGTFKESGTMIPAVIVELYKP
jgi:phospholipid N-methyltransferase